MTGTVLPFAGATAPDGWMLCYGQAVSRATYATLFAVIGTTFGVGDGSTTFNLPDLRGRVAAGKDDRGGAAAARLTNTGTGNPGVNGAALGAAGGADRNALSTAQLPAHAHGYGYGSNTARLSNSGGSETTLIAGSNLNTQNAGSGESHPNVQPTIILNSIIKL